MPPKKAGGGGTIDFATPEQFQCASTLSTEWRPVAVPDTFSDLPVAPDPEGDAKAAAAAEKAYADAWGAADVTFEDADFKKDSLPNCSSGVSFSGIAAWRRPGEWLQEQGCEENGMVVVAPPPVSDQEIRDLTLRVAKLQEKKPLKTPPEDGEPPPEEEEDVPEPDPELDEALAALHSEGARRFNGFHMEGIEETMRWLASMLAVFVSNRAKVADGSYLWENIYPKGHDGLPTVNPNGKYAVKLFMQGEWRTVFVDDSIPFDNEGRPMLPMSALEGPTREIWPLLLCKAVLKAYQGLSKGNSIEDALCYATAITGWMQCCRSRKSYSVEQWYYMQQAIQNGQLMLAAAAESSGLLSPAGFVGDHMHSIQQVQQVLDVTMVRLESNQSKCKPMLFLEREAAAGQKTTLDGESLRCQIEAELEVHAKVHTTADVLQSFWMSRPDFDAAFDLLITSYDISSHEHHQVKDYLWENLEAPLPTPPKSLIYTNNEESAEILFCTTCRSSAWEAPPCEENAEADGDAPMPAPPVAPPPPEVQFMVEEWSWDKGHLKRVVNGVTTHSSCAAFKVNPGPHIYRIHMESTAGYNTFVSSRLPFVFGDYETVLKEHAQLPSVTTVDAPTQAVPASRTSALFRTNITIPEGTSARVAAYLEIDDPSLKKNLRLRFIDNEKGTSMPYMSLFMPGRVLPSTPLGYTLALECSASAEAPAPSSNAHIVVIADAENVTTELANMDTAREVSGEQELNLSKDTVLLKYLLEPDQENEVAAFELVVNGSDRGLTMELLDKNHAQLQVTRGVHQCNLVYCPLPFKEEEDTFTLLCTIQAPDADLMAAEADKMKEQQANSEGGAEIGAAMKCMYSLTVTSLSAFAVSVDTRRQDRAIELKGEWEDSEKGRAERAKTARDKFLCPPASGEEEVNLGAKDPSKGRRPAVKSAGAEQATAHVQTAEERAERLEKNEKALEDYKAAHEAHTEAQAEQANVWRTETQSRTQASEARTSDTNEFWTQQNARLDAYRISLLSEEEQEAARKGKK